MTTVAEAPAPPRWPGFDYGGLPARRAVTRWAWRLFRREWRQQILVLALLAVAVAATTVGAGFALNTPPSEAASFGTADYLVSLPAGEAWRPADLAAAARQVGPVEVITHQNLAVPGTVTPVDLRSQDPHGRYGHPMLRLAAGAFPAGPDQVAVTDGVASLFSLRVGSVFRVNGHDRRVVGLVENPLNLRDEFALVAPGQAAATAAVTVLIRADARTFGSFHLPNGSSVSSRSTALVLGPTGGVLILATIGLLFIGLVAVAGFTVIAGRRQRALGLLAALGATDRNVRLVMLAGGALLGAAGAVTGAGVGLAVWLALAPRLERIAEHRIDRFDLPWWTIGAAVLLAVVTSLVAAWWPARAVARLPVVAALSARPAPPRPARRFGALGGTLLLAGLGLLALSAHRRPILIVGGIVATTVGALMLAPLGLRGLPVLARRAPVTVRLAVRDLARYQARAGAALAAVTLAMGIAATIAVSASAAQAKADVPLTEGALPTNELIVWLAPQGGHDPIPDRSPTQVASVGIRVGDLAAALHARDTITLYAAVNPTVPLVPGLGGAPAGREGTELGWPIRVSGGREMFTSANSIALYVATPALLARYGIDPTSVRPDTDLLTSRASLAGYEPIPGRYPGWHPKIQHVRLPTYTSDPTILITTHAMGSLGLRPTAAGWLIRLPHPLTAAQIVTARHTAAGVGASIETRPTRKSLARLRTGATAVGLLAALGVLAMTVGLIRAETAGDLRTLTATGAGAAVRRTLTGATAGALALLGAVLGTAGAYLALVAWHHDDVGYLSHPPVVSLLAMIVGLPAVAAVGGWLLAGREPPALTRRPLE